MATNRAKESSGVGKEKRVLPLDSQSKKSRSSSRTAEKGSSGSEKQVPNYLKPTVSSRLETHQRSFQLRSDSTSNPNLDRRRSFDRPPSVSKFLKQASPSTSRLHKALVSPGPRERTAPQRADSSVSAKSSTVSSKPISAKTVRDGKSQQPVSTLKSTVKKSSTSSRNKAASAAKSSTKAPKTNNAETTETTLTINVEEADHEQETKEAASDHDGVAEEVEKVEKVDDVSQETPALVNGDQHADNEVGESDHDPQIVSDDDKVIPCVSEEVNTDPGIEEEKEAVTTEKAVEEEKAENDEHEVVEYIKQDKEEENETKREENINQDKEEESNDEISQPQEIPASTEGELAEVKEREHKEEKQEEQQHHEVENSQDVKKELEDKEVTEGDNGRISEEVDLKEQVEEEGHDHQVEAGTEEAGNKNEEATKNESTAVPKQEAASSGGKGKKESNMAYNDVIEETKNKLMGTRKNKVSALVGAFQTVIDYESSSK